uniref:Putative conserved secreted protein n=1 Tax=Rhipicephalus microplus TaxID=6941 RepID=A0A6M2CYM2_RHIMP
MKSFVLLFALTLLSAALLTEAQRFPGGGGFPRPGGGRRCGNVFCRPGQRCVYERVVCIRAPCPPIPQCV